MIYHTASDPAGTPARQRHAFIRMTTRTLCALEVGTQVIAAVPQVRWDETKDDAPRCPKCVARGV